VEQFEKTARYVMRKLDQTLEQIEACNDSNSVIEDMKLSIAPDAALILSQGDTLILETHGKNSDLTHKLLDIQKALRDKYKDMQNANTTNISLLEKENHSGAENQYSPKEKVFVDKKFPVDLLQQTSTASIRLEDLVEKVLKRVKDLVTKPVDHSSEDDLTKRILDIGVSGATLSLYSSLSRASDHFFSEFSRLENFRMKKEQRERDSERKANCSPFLVSRRGYL
jgi:gas vesicle protein